MEHGRVADDRDKPATTGPETGADVVGAQVSWWPRRRVLPPPVGLLGVLLDAALGAGGPSDAELASAEEERQAAPTFGNGIYVVGEDVEAATYRTDGGGTCYWARRLTPLPSRAWGSTPSRVPRAPRCSPRASPTSSLSETSRPPSACSARGPRSGVKPTSSAEGWPPAARADLATSTA